MTKNNNRLRIFDLTGRKDGQIQHPRHRSGRWFNSHSSHPETSPRLLQRTQQIDQPRRSRCLRSRSPDRHLELRQIRGGSRSASDRRNSSVSRIGNRRWSDDDSHQAQLSCSYSTNSDFHDVRRQPTRRHNSSIRRRTRDDQGQ